MPINSLSRKADLPVNNQPMEKSHESVLAAKRQGSADDARKVRERFYSRRREERGRLLRSAGIGNFGRVLKGYLGALGG